MASNHQKLGRGWDRLSLTASEGTSSANTLVLDFQPPELGDSKYLLFKPLSVWYFAAPGNCSCAQNHDGRRAKFQLKVHKNKKVIFSPSKASDPRVLLLVSIQGLRQAHMPDAHISKLTTAAI